MKQKTKLFLLLCLKYTSIALSLPFIAATKTTRVDYFLFSGITDWSVIKIEEYDK